MKKSFIIIISLFLLASYCNAQTQFEEKKVGHIFYVSIPDYMKRTASLNNSAIIQYQNDSIAAYTIVIDDSKKEIELSGADFASVKNYYDFFIEGFRNKSTEIFNKKSITINNYNAYQVQIRKNIEKTKIFYLITIIESENYYYNIISWTLFDNKDLLIEDFEKIANSFKE